MLKFSYDILKDYPEDNEVLKSEESVRSIQLPAYATEQQRKELFFEIIDALDEVSFTSQRLRLDVGKDFLTLRRELGGGWQHKEDDDDAFETTSQMTGVMNELNNAINEELDEMRKNQNEKD